MRNRFTGPFLIHDVLNSTVLAESCCTGKLGYLHKSFLRNIPEKDMNKYETILGLSKLKLGSGHTNAECQDLLHQNRLLEMLDGQHKMMKEMSKRTPSHLTLLPMMKATNNLQNCHL